jgi:hypothetical protein
MTKCCGSNMQHILILTYSRSWALLEEPPIVQPLKKFPAFYGTRRFNTEFTRVLHWSLSWAISSQSTPSHPISLRSILILSNHLRLGLPSGLFQLTEPTKAKLPMLLCALCLVYISTIKMEALHALWNNHKFLPDYTTSHDRKYDSSTCHIVSFYSMRQ